MKIKNDLVSIKIGRKQCDFRNLILDTYLEKFALTQLDITNARKIGNQKSLTCLLIKFDTPIQNLNENSILVNEDFDVYVLLDTSYVQELTDSTIIVQYSYNTKKVLSYTSSDFSEAIDISNFWGRKITALGFNSTPTKSDIFNTNVKAVLDTSNYNIYLQENQDFVVTRKDIITTDALFYTNSKEKIAGPIHLAPFNNKAVITPNTIYNDTGNMSITGDNTSYGLIYSIGLSSYIDRIDKEFVIGKDVEITQNGAELEIKGLNNAISKEFMHPNENIYPSSNLYPTKSNYKYLIIKYKVWQELLSGTYDNPVYTITDTGYFYYQAIPITKFGDLNLKIKYERG